MIPATSTMMILLYLHSCWRPPSLQTGYMFHRIKYSKYLMSFMSCQIYRVVYDIWGSQSGELLRHLLVWMPCSLVGKYEGLSWNPLLVRTSMQTPNPSFGRQLCTTCSTLQPWRWRHKFPVNVGTYVPNGMGNIHKACNSMSSLLLTHPLMSWEIFWFDYAQEDISCDCR